MITSGWALLFSAYPGQVTGAGMSALHLAFNSVAQVLLQLRATQIPAEHNPA